VLYDIPCGHAACSRILPLGVNAEVDAEDESGSLRCEIGVKW